MSDTVLITGGAGFIGAHIARALAERGDRVISYDLVVPAKGSPIEWLLSPVSDKIEFIRGDVNNLAGLLLAVRDGGPTKIVHAAVMNDVETLLNNPVQSFRVIAEGSLNVFEAARLHKLKRVVYTSSISVYARRQYEPMDENHPLLLAEEFPVWFYSPGKIAAEAFAQAYWGVLGVDCVGLRLSAVYGFGMKYDMYIKSLVENAVDRLPTRITTGDMVRDYTYVGDVVQGVLLALDAVRLKSRIFNISTGRSLANVFEVGRVVKQVVPEADIDIKAGLTEMEEREIQSRGRLDIERARRELGFEPKYDLAKGISEYVQMLRDFEDSRRH